MDTIFSILIYIGLLVFVSYCAYKLALYIKNKRNNKKNNGGE